MTEPLVIDQGSSRPGRWLQDRRWRIALWIAVVECIVVAVAHEVSRWTVIAAAILALVLYAYVGRRTRSDVGHQVLWIAGASQLLAVIGVIVAFFIFWLAFIVAAIFAVVALAYFLFDRR